MVKQQLYYTNEASVMFERGLMNILLREALSDGLLKNLYQAFLAREGSTGNHASTRKGPDRKVYQYIMHAATPSRGSGHEVIWSLGEETKPVLANCLLCFIGIVSIDTST